MSEVAHCLERNFYDITVLNSYRDPQMDSLPLSNQTLSKTIRAREKPIFSGSITLRAWAIKGDRSLYTASFRRFFPGKDKD